VGRFTRERVGLYLTVEIYEFYGIFPHFACSSFGGGPEGTP